MKTETTEKVRVLRKHCVTHNRSVNGANRSGDDDRYVQVHMCH